VSHSSRRQTRKPTRGLQLLLKHPLSRGMQLCIICNANTGERSFDYTKNGHDCTWTNGDGTTDWDKPANNIGGIARDFDGSNDHGALGTMDIFADDFQSKADGITMEIMLKLDDISSPSDMRFLSKASSTAEDDHEWMLGGVDSGGNERVRTRIQDGAGLVETSVSDTGPALVTGTWYHIFGLWRHKDLVLGGGSVIEHWVNNVRTFRGATITIAQADGLTIASTISAEIGRNPGASPFGAMQGQVAWCRIWNYGLSPESIKWLFKKPFCMFYEDSIARWAQVAAAPTRRRVIIIGSALWAANVLKQSLKNEKCSRQKFFKKLIWS